MSQLVPVDSELLKGDTENLELGMTGVDELEDEEDGTANLIYPNNEDDDEDDEPGLTSKSKSGRVWELNEDTYVTVTEPGESYGYELDMEDQEDQDMASIRRGKQGGWSSGQNMKPASDYPEGSREWIARRSYELMTKASYKDMLRWSKWHEDPPPEIAELYPENPRPTTPLGERSIAAG